MRETDVVEGLVGGMRAARTSLGRWALVVICAGVGIQSGFGCGGAAVDEQGLGQDVSAVRAAVDEAEQRLDEQGSDDDDAMVRALVAHGLGTPSVDLLRAEALKGLLLRTARSMPEADVGALVENTLTGWHAIAVLERSARLAALGSLAGFDALAKPVRISAEQAATASRTVENGLDARGRRLWTSARTRVLEAISAHLDLTQEEAALHLPPVGEQTAHDGALAALDFTGTLASSPSDPARAAARALRRSWQALVDRDFPDEAWTTIAGLIGQPLPPSPAPARPSVAVRDAVGLSCTALPSGLACAGTASAGVLRMALDGVLLEVPVTSTTPAATVLDALRARLPPSVAGCTTGERLPFLRLDQTAPALEGTPLTEVTIAERVVSSPSAQRSPRPDNPPRELVVHGRFRTDGLRPAFLVDFSGCELRVMLIAQAARGAPREFEVRLSLSSRLPKRTYEALLTDVLGRTLATVSL